MLVNRENKQELDHNTTKGIHVMKLYAHIINARKATGFKFELIISEDYTYIRPTGKSYFYNSRKDAKQQAKALNAISWNY